jgi:hypothetical protein
MENPAQRDIFKIALSGGILLLACAALPVAGANPPAADDAAVSSVPDPARGRVEDSGKFVPTGIPREIPQTPTTPDVEDGKTPAKP